MSLHLRFLSGSLLRKIVFLLVAFCVPLTANAVDIEWVNIGDARNPADTAVMVTDGTTGYGSVRYDFEVGTVEVTNSQYVEFLNSVVSYAGPMPTASTTLRMEADEAQRGDRAT